MLNLRQAGGQDHRVPRGTGRGPRFERVPAIMGVVALALVPGLVAQVVVYGAGVAVNLGVGLVLALGLETCVGPRGLGWCRHVDPFDGAASVTVLLVVAGLPAGAPWWVLASSLAFGLVFAKFVYGGLGQNPFNPAMAAIAFALVSFPGEMTQWFSSPVVGGEISAWLAGPDGFTGATALDRVRELRVAGEDTSLRVPRAAWVVSLAYLAGGIALLGFRLIGWILPTATVLGLALASIVFEAGGAWYEGVAFHLFNGAAVLAAFFVVTDPVTAPRTASTQWTVGLLVGAGIYVIRAWGNFPDGVAFAVLAANMLTPALERLGDQLEPGSS